MEEAESEGEELSEVLSEESVGEDELETEVIPQPDTTSPLPRKSTVHLIERAIERLIRAGGRKSEAEAATYLKELPLSCLIRILVLTSTRIYQSRVLD